MKSSPKKSFNTTGSPHNNKRKAPPRKNAAELSPKNEVKEMFIKHFKKNNNVGYVMSKQDVVRNILTQLNAKQEDALQEALLELKDAGWIEIKEDGVTLVLTQKI
ncbi:hypothetical protein KKG72_03200 [bacterium]|nr:hypothetical protein [bacterium]MBU1994193.1 hypothetical protein [bacterium]